MAEETVQLTIRVPDHVYRQALHIAEENRRSLEEVIADALSGAFPVVHVNPERARMEREQAAFRRLHPELVARYPNEFVAIHNGEVVGHDKSQLELVARIDEEYAEQVVLVRAVRTEPEERVLVFRSPRLIRE